MCWIRLHMIFFYVYFERTIVARLTNLVLKYKEFIS